MMEIPEFTFHVVESADYERSSTPFLGSFYALGTSNTSNRLLHQIRIQNIQFEFHA